MFRGSADKGDGRSKALTKRLTAVQQRPRVDGDDAQTVDRVLKGNVQQTLPQPKAKCIRLFVATSSYAGTRSQLILLLLLPSPRLA